MLLVNRRTIIAGAGAMAASSAAGADEPIRIGLISTTTGPFAANGRQIEDAVRLYVQKNGDTIAGRKIEVIVKNDTGQADVTRRLAQELIANDRVNFLAGFTLSPGALATAPLATQTKTPMVVMLGATSIIPDQSPFIVRSSLSAAQLGVSYGKWIAEQNLQTMVTLVADYAPGQDYEALVTRGFESGGGKVLAKLRAPLASPEFAPYVQRAVDLKPSALFIFVPAGGMGAALMKQLTERRVSNEGIRIFAEGSLLDEEFVNGIGDNAVGYVTTGTYSPAHDSDVNRAFVEGFVKLSGRRPNIVGVYAYDGMHLIYEALRRTTASNDGQKNLDAMMGLSWESPRGPVSLDPTTRDLIQNVYVRRAERRADGQVWHAEFATIPNVKDPTRPALK